MDCSTPGFPVLQYLQEFAETHAHWVGDAIQQSLPVSSSSPCALSLSSIRVFSNESALWIRCPNVSASVLPMNIQDWFSLGLTYLITLLSKGLSRVFSNTAAQKIVLWRLAFFMVQHSHQYMTTRKTIALAIWTSVSKAMSLLFNMLSTFVIAFLQRSKHLLILWLQSPSTVILEHKIIKSLSVSIVSTSTCNEVMGLDAMMLVF